jgi:hypothetical protein
MKGGESLFIHGGVEFFLLEIVEDGFKALSGEFVEEQTQQTQGRTNPGNMTTASS